MSASEYVESRGKAFVASEAIGAHILVKLNGSGLVSIAGTTDRPIGVTRVAVASGAEVSVELLSAQGTLLGFAAAAIAEGAILFGKAAGKLDDADAGSEIKVGVALEAAGAAGDIIEFMPALQL